jgi:hypothetical protein
MFFPFLQGPCRARPFPDGPCSVDGKKEEGRRGNNPSGTAWMGGYRDHPAKHCRFAFSLEKNGFLVYGFLFICLLLEFVEPQIWKNAIVGATIATVAAGLLFNVVF